MHETLKWPGRLNTYVQTTEDPLCCSAEVGGCWWWGPVTGCRHPRVILQKHRGKQVRQETRLEPVSAAKRPLPYFGKDQVQGAGGKERKRHVENTQDLKQAF